MAIKNGTDLLLSIVTGTTPSKVIHIIGCAKSHSISISNEVRDTTSKCTVGWKTSAKNRTNWTASAEGLVSYDSTNYNYGTLLGLMLDGAPVMLASFDYEGATGTAPNLTPQGSSIVYRGNALITSIDMGAADGENATFNLTFEGVDELKELTYTAFMAE